MVEEMLEGGIIMSTQSSYSELVVNVHKKEGSLHMCPNYRDINNITIKDKFPIPVIDELLDELHGVGYFTKLDLHSGYHRIRMSEEDIPKITFKTHEGHSFWPYKCTFHISKFDEFHFQALPHKICVSIF